MKMMLHKRMEHGSGEHKVPPMPRVPRSAKGKRSIRKKHEDKQTSAFDLLATVAGELLLERENSPTNGNVKHGQKDERPLKVEVFNHVSCNESTLHFETVNKRQVDCSLKEQSQTPKSLEKNANKLLVTGKRELCECKAEIKRMNAIDENFTEILEDPMDLDVKPLALVSSDSSVKVPVLKTGSFPKCPDVSELIVDRDDDENSSGCTHPSTNAAKAFKPQCIGDRRVRKLLASKFWKVPSSALKNGELSNTDVDGKPIIRNRKMCYVQQGSQRSSFKRRKMFERCSISASDLDIYGESVCSSPKFSGIETEGSDAHSSLNGANRASSSTSVPKSSYKSGNYHVKFSIKSFNVPELFIEIPETATVGSLKRTVVEAVTVILAGGLRVGVLLEGKKVRDDKQTLLQAGISRNDKIENLGFSLEPNPTQTPPSLTCPEDPNNLLASKPVLPCASIEPAQRIPVVTPAIIDHVTPEPPQISTLNNPDSDHDSVYSNTDASSSVDKAANSKAIVPVPAMTADPVSMAPPRKSRRAELAQRRIRRPFSVAEVEALVHAVEKLGTGRWRDVKIRAFDNTKHRTYVDLKDKWKTLVHTARISPQQRRGEPVPQVLLDRVLSAHAYWSQQQAKLQVKPSQAEPCLLI